MEQLPKIVQRGLRATAKPGDHPDPDLLAAFAERSLTDRERAPVLQHLAACAECRDVLVLAMPEEEPAPLPSPKKSFLLSWPVLRWGALAACVIVVSAAVTLRYQRRQVFGPSLDRTVAVTQESHPLESNVRQDQGEKLAANVPSSAPFPQDAEKGSAGKLAETRRKDGDAGMTAALSVSPPPGPEQDRLFQESANKGLAGADAVKSAASLPEPVAPQPAAGAAPSPAGGPQARESQSKVPTDILDSHTRPNTRSLRAESAPMAPPPASPMATPTSKKAQPAEEKAKDEISTNELHKEVPAAGAGSQNAGSLTDRKVDAVSAETAQTSTQVVAKRSTAVISVLPRWTLSAAGVLQRSFDSGRTWQTIPVADNVVFRALAANNSDVWVGGTAGALYHSSDAGQHWTQAKPMSNGRLLTADIVGVEFSDAQHGKLTTANREIWTTRDAGTTWQSQ